jgi:hypothetical protein
MSVSVLMGLLVLAVGVVLLSLSLIQAARVSWTVWRVVREVKQIERGLRSALKACNMEGLILTPTYKRDQIAFMLNKPVADIAVIEQYLAHRLGRDVSIPQPNEIIISRTLTALELAT